ncbi:MAG: hypothetical protein SGPRY_002033, partial [Prymnesium sp.]
MGLWSRQTRVQANPYAIPARLEFDSDFVRSAWLTLQRRPVHTYDAKPVVKVYVRECATPRADLMSSSLLPFCTLRATGVPGVECHNVLSGHRHDKRGQPLKEVHQMCRAELTPVVEADAFVPEEAYMDIT